MKVKLLRILDATVFVVSIALVIAGIFFGLVRR